MRRFDLIFLATLLILCSCTNNFKNLQNVENNKTDFSDIQFIVDLNQENPKADEVPFNCDGDDFFGFNKKYTVGQIAPNIMDTLKTKALKIRKFLKKNNLWNNGFSNPAKYTFSTTDKHAVTSLLYFKAFIKELFAKPNIQNISLSSKTLTENERDELLGQTREEIHWKFDLILLSYGYFRKRSGLNLSISFCRHMMDELQKRWKNINEFKTFLSTNDFTDLLIKISDLYKDKYFIGQSANGAWVFNGNERPLLSSGWDVYNFLRTVVFDNPHREEIIEIQKSDYNKLLELNKKFLLYFENSVDFICSRFFAFLVELLNRRSYINENPLSTVKLPLKKWLSIGVKNTIFLYMTEFLKDRFGVEYHNSHPGQSFFFAFAGPKENKITHINIFDDNMKLFGRIDIADFLKFSQINLSDNDEFNRRCLGKSNVENFEYDY